MEFKWINEGNIWNSSSCQLSQVYLCFQNMLINCMLKINYGHIWRCCCEERNAAEGNCEEYCKGEKDLCHIGTAELYAGKVSGKSFTHSYRNNFIIKGGFLIASMIGLDSRTTKDLDATIIGYPVSAESVQRMTEEILSVPVDDHISFSFKGIVAKEYEISKFRFWKQEYKYVGGAK